MYKLEENIPVNGMNLDVDLRMFRKGQTRFAKNIRFFSNDSGQSWTAEGAIGNEHVFVIPAQSAQYKQALIYPASDTGDYTIQISGIQKLIASTDAVWADFITTLDADLTTAGLTFTLTLAAQYQALFPDSYLLTIQTAPYLDWQFVSLTESTLGIIVLQDAIDDQMAGSFIPLVGENLGNKLYVLATTQQQMPFSIENGATLSDNAGTFDVTFNTQPFTEDYTGQIWSINISGDTDTSNSGKSWINGIWQAEWISPTTINLLESTYSANSDNGITVVFFTRGVGGLFGFDKTATTEDSFLSVVSTQWAFRLPKQIKCYVESNVFGDSIYWCDHYNGDKYFYCNKGMLQDGGLYNLNTIGEATTIDRSNDCKIEFVTQYDSGGGITSGNWVYAIGLKGVGNQIGKISFISNPVNVYKASTQNFYHVIGDKPGTITGKVNELLIYDIPPNVYQSLVLFGLNFTGQLTVAAERIKEVAIPASVTELTIQHTGLESGIETADAGTLQFLVNTFYASKNIDVLENNMVRSNLKAIPLYDFSDFALTLRHSVLRKELPTVGANNGTDIAEFQVPYNVNHYAGYMINEQQRYGLQIKLKGYSEYQPFIWWVDDIRIDSSATNDCPTTDNPLRRITGLTDHNLTDDFSGDHPTVIYVPYIQFEIPDFGILINGTTPARDLIEEIRIMRVPNVNPRILGMGLAVAVVKWNGSGSSGLIPGSGNQDQEIWPYMSGSTAVHDYSTDTVYDYPEQMVGLYMVDQMYTGNVISSFLPDDELIGMNQPTHLFQLDVTRPTFFNPSYYTPYSGYFQCDVASQGSYLITDLKTCDRQSSIQIGGIIFYNALNDIQFGGQEYWYNYPNTVCAISSFPVFSAVYPKPIGVKGFFVAQYLRDRGMNQFGAQENSTYIDCNAFTQNIVDDVTIDVFGGDTFTQRVYFKYRNRINSNATSGLAEDSADSWGEGGVAFYVQCRVNAQMRQKAYDDQIIFPNDDLTTWLTNPQMEEFSYNDGYTIDNNILLNKFRAYNPLLPYVNDYPVRSVWSNNKPDGSTVDDYLVTPPYNFKDLDLSNGEIMHHASLNKDMYFWQLYAFCIQPGSSNTVISGADGQETIVGSGGFFSREWMRISNYGTQHGFGVSTFGNSKGGKQVAMWIDARNKMICRHGADGTVPISDVQDISSWLKNNLPDYIPDTPALGYGITSVYNQEFREWLWTVRGIRYDYTDFFFREQCEIGDVCLFQLANDTSFEQTGTVYVCTDNNSKGYCELTDISDWTIQERIEEQKTLKGGIIPKSDYYTEYTLSFADAKQTSYFLGFWSFLPRIYFRLGNSFVTPHPGVGFGNLKNLDTRLYLHNQGEVMTWYQTDEIDAPLVRDGWIEQVTNEGRLGIKQFIAMQLNTLLEPYRIEFVTKDHESYLDRGEFENEWGLFESPVKSDSSVSGINTSDTELLRGVWMIHRLILHYQEEQKLFNIFVVVQEQGLLTHNT